SVTVNTHSLSHGSSAAVLKIGAAAVSKHSATASRDPSPKNAGGMPVPQTLLPVNPTSPVPPVSVPIETPSPSSSGPLPANVARTLQTIYQAFLDNNGTVPSSQTGRVVVNGTDVGVQVKSNETGDFAAFVTQLQNAGMQIITSDARYGVVVGMVPINQL